MGKGKEKDIELGEQGVKGDWEGRGRWKMGGERGKIKGMEVAVVTY